MKSSSSWSRIGAVNTGPLSRPAVTLLDPPTAGPAVSDSCRVEGRAEVLRQAFEIQHPTDQVRLLPDPREPAATEAPQAMPVLTLAEEFLDELPAPLRQAIPKAALAHAHTSVGRTAAPHLRRDMRLDAPSEQRLEEVFVKEPLVGAERGRREAQPPFRPVQQRETAHLLRRAALEDLHAEPEQHAMAVLHHRIDGVAWIGACPRLPLETNRQSGSVTERWVALPRFSPRKSSARLPGSDRPPSAARSCARSRRLYSAGSRATSMGSKLLKLALARTSVPSTLTWRLTNPAAIARLIVSSKRCSKTPDSSNRRRRFWLNVEASQASWSRFNPTNQRRAMLHCSSTTSFRSLVIPSR